jgi:hypothetical protein
MDSKARKKDGGFGNIFSPLEPSCFMMKLSSKVIHEC